MHWLDVDLEAVGVVKNDLSQRVEEQVLLLGVTLSNLLENLIEEELRVADGELTK